MRYMGFVIMDPAKANPPQALMDAMDAHIGASAAAGIFLDGGGLGRTAGFQVRSGELSATDGPFSEAKEIVGGYAVLELRDDAEAAEEARKLADLHRQHWPEWEGRVEIHRIEGAPEPA